MNTNAKQPDDSGDMHDQGSDAPDKSSGDAASKGSSPKKQSPRESFPPSIGRLYCWLVYLAWIFTIGLGSCVVLGFCFWEASHPSMFLTYTSIAFVLPTLYLHLYAYLPVWIHKDRLEDRSIVDGVILEANTIEPRLEEPDVRPLSYEKKARELKNEADCLKEGGYQEWTEYRVLNLNQMIVDFLKPEDLVARAHSSLADLENFAEDDSYGGYDRKEFVRWEERITKAMGRIERVEEDHRNVPNSTKKSSNSDYNEQRDEAAEELRASLKTVLEHVADYKKNWSEGSRTIQVLMVFCVVAIPTFLVMGLLRGVHPDADTHVVLAGMDWGFLGIGGSFTAVLLGLRKSNAVEVGDTEGKRELKRAVQGGALGLIAGIISYLLVVGGLLMGGALPEIADIAIGTPKDVALSVLAAFSAGFFFEPVFERLRASTTGLT